MKTALLSILSFVIITSAKAQYTQNFEGTEAGLTSNCWTLDGIYRTTDPADVITGIGSMYTNPPTNSISRSITTPALNLTSPLFTVSFKYKLSSMISGNATRTIEIGLLSDGVFTSLHTITMDKYTLPIVHNFNQTFVTLPGVKRLVLRLGGTNGDGNSRIIFDDLSTSANARYGSGTCNSAPIAVNDVYIGAIGSVISGNILANDNEPDGETMTPSIVNNANGGILVLNTLGQFTFTPNLNFNGNTVTFTYKLDDNGVDPLSSNTALVTINYTSPIILPVKLISFNAFLNNEKVDLKWVTSEEMNVSHFVVERSTDGQNFSDAGTVFAIGNTTSNSNYNFSDNLGSLRSAVIYYRLRSVDIDGKSQYSETRIIRLDDKAENTITILTFPNPVTNELKVTIPSTWQNKRVSYELFRVNGQSVKKTENLSSSQTETINVSNLQTGVYLVRVSCEGQTINQKIIKN